MGMATASGRPSARTLMALAGPTRRPTGRLTHAVSRACGVPPSHASQWLHRIWLQNLRVARYSVSTVTWNTKDEQSDSEKQREGKDPSKKHFTEEEADDEKEEEEEDDAGDKEEEEQEPLPWGRLLLMFGLLGGAIFFGSRTVMELFPSSTTPQSIRNRAFSKLEGDPEVVQAFGELTVMYGANYGHSRGRRNFVPSYTYEKNGKKFTRIKFTVENDRKQPAMVYVEVDHSRPSEFHYLMLEMPSRRVLNLVDNREPEKPRDVRQEEVARRLMTVSSKFYSKGPIDAMSRAQSAQLGSAWENLERTHVVRCDINEHDCERDGITSPPAWRIRGKQYQGMLKLEDLERILFEDSQ